MKQEQNSSKKTEAKHDREEEPSTLKLHAPISKQFLPFLLTAAILSFKKDNKVCLFTQVYTCPIAKQEQLS